MNNINIDTLDLNLLKVFEALHEEGSASRAALRLALTQSAVSAALRRLRGCYNDPLFTRTGRGLAPTPRANELKPLISDALNKCRESLMLLDVSQTATQRTVSLGLSDDFEMALGHRILQAIRQQAPSLRVVFRQTHSRVVADMLLHHELDLALTAGGFAYQALHSEMVAQGNYACLMDRAFLPYNQHTLTIEEFIARPHLLISHGGYIGLVDEVLARLQLKRQLSASTTHFAAIPWLLKDNNTVTTIPAHAARAIVAVATDLVCLPCPVAMPDYAIEVGFRQAASRDRAIMQVKQIIAQIAHEYYW
jgi:LysR family transcriptional activator of mexEF-oprN operon